MSNSDAAPKYVLSLDRFDHFGNEVCYLNIVDFLFGKKEIMHENGNTIAIID